MFVPTTKKPSRWIILLLLSTGFYATISGGVNTDLIVRRENSALEQPSSLSFESIRQRRRSLIGSRNAKFHNHSSSESCHNYSLQFLNGTTDKRDKCKAHHKAFVAANCRTVGEAATATKNTTNNSDYFILSNIECCDTMEQFYLRNCAPSRTSGAVSTMILWIIAIVLLCATAQAFLDYANAKWIPDAAAFILIGAAISGLAELLRHYHNPSATGNIVHNHLYFDEAFFLQMLLPPTIFQAALSIDKPSFGRHLAPILLFATLGTALSAVSIGGMAYWMTGGYLPLLESLVFGALISSIDPVATLGILSGVGADPSSTLYALIAGESLLNDAVAIVLFDTLQSHLGDATVLDDPSTYQSMVWHFVTVSLGSMMVAIVTGLCAILFFWSLRRRQYAVVELATFFGWALIPYYVGEALEFSGIIAILTMGFIMDFYILGCAGTYAATIQACQPGDFSEPSRTVEQIINGRGLLSADCCEHIGFVSHAFATTMETIIFAYLGLFLFDDKVYSMALDQAAVWSCIISRAFMVVLLSWCVNACANLHAACKPSTGETDTGTRDSTIILDRKTQIMLFLAGIRGAVSFALVSKLPVYDVVTQEGTQFKAEIKAMTSTAIIFTLFVFGALAYFVVDRLPSYDLYSEDVQASEFNATRPLKDNNESRQPEEDYGSTHSNL